MTHTGRSCRKHAPRLWLGWLTLALQAAVSCTIDGPEACDDNQVYVEDRALLEYTVCVCDVERGYVLDQTRGYGCKQCQTGQHIVAGRCVNDDTTEVDAGGPREPTGVGEYCETADDCASFDATYCARNSCLIEACASGENTCGSATSCCDYSALLAGFSLCLPDDQLNDGECPMGGKRVEP